MSDEEIDRALGGNDDIVPSSGFAGAVMEAVRREAAAPPPIPFPWKWAIPGLVAWAAALAVAIVALTRLTSFDASATALGLGIPLWAGATVLALAGALLSVLWSMRLTGART
jgi:hypothetical protein